MNTTTQHGVSVVICCFDSAERLPDTLRHVARQSVPPHIPWEVVVVDNASTDQTAEVARQEWSKVDCREPFRVVTQPVPGLSAARDLGLEEAAFEFVLFCDDDNWLDADYVRHVYERMAGDARIGAVGGHGRAVSEGPLPAWFLRYGRYFAVGPQGDASGDVTDARGYLYGAGCAVRRSILLGVKRLGYASRLSGRKGRILSSGDDLEISYLIRLAGYRLWFDERLEFAHYMPVSRLRWTYFLRLVEGTHRSRPYVDAFLRTLRGEAEGTGSRRWLAEWLRIGRRMVGRPKTLAMALLGREGNPASVRIRQWRGELAGWWTARSDHDALMRELRSLRERLTGPDGLSGSAAGMPAAPPGATDRPRMVGHPAPEHAGETVRHAVSERTRAAILALPMSDHPVPSAEPPIRLSVVIPCFNAAETIAEQLDALAEQDWSEPWELIIADNGSTDATRQVVERYRERIPHLRVVDAPGRQGAEHARNEGVKAARGSLLAFCDADDVVAPDWVGAVARALEQHDLVACRLDGDRLNTPEVLEIRECPQQDGLMRFRYSDFLPFASTCGLGVRRSAFESIDGFDEDLFLGGDIDFCWRAQLHGFDLQFVPEALVHYRMRSDLRGIYRQTFLYAMWTVPVYTRYLEHGMPPVRWHDGVRAWLRLLVRLPPSLLKKKSRIKWMRQFTYRWGLVRGSIRWRRLVL